MSKYIQTYLRYSDVSRSRKPYPADHLPDLIESIVPGGILSVLFQLTALGWGLLYPECTTTYQVGLVNRIESQNIPFRLLRTLALRSLNCESFPSIERSCSSAPSTLNLPWLRATML